MERLMPKCWEKKYSFRVKDDSANDTSHLSLSHLCFADDVTLFAKSKRALLADIGRGLGAVGWTAERRQLQDPVLGNSGTRHFILTNDWRPQVSDC